VIAGTVRIFDQTIIILWPGGVAFSRESRSPSGDRPQVGEPPLAFVGGLVDGGSPLEVALVEFEFFPLLELERFEVLQGQVTRTSIG
jgi:hypothetical protein